jgi:signal transduction histidine kinase
MDDTAALIAQLRRDNAALDERVKLLVQTEQRFFVAQADVDRQLERMKALAQLSLECATLDDPSEILARGVRLLLTTFHADAVGALLRDGRTGALTAVPWPDTTPPPDVVTAASRALPGFVEHLLAQPDGLAHVSPPPDWLVSLAAPGADPSRLVLLPLRPSEGQHGVIVLERSAHRASVYRQAIDTRHHPFLHLLAQHLERAIERAALTAALRSRTHALERANAELAASMENLGRAQEQLVQARKVEAIGRLAGGVAHDFNNLLTVIITYAELARESLDPESPERTNVASVIDAAQRAASITRQLLALSRRQPQRRESIDLNELTGNMARMFARVIGEQVELRLDLDPRVPTVWADRAQLEQVVLNLVLNGRDAMPAGGRLSISTRPAMRADLAGLPDVDDATQFVALLFTDTGVGMDDATRAHLFEPFFTTKGLGKGTGLGLAVVHSIVTQTGGHIRVSSQPGHGSCFTVLLPIMNPLDEPAGVTAARRGPGARGVVLLVEDDDTIRRVAERVLGSAGYHVIPAADGAEALGIVDQGTSFDILVCDVVMPNMGGIPLAGALAERRPALPLVLMSGYPADDIDPRLHALYLPKPFTPQQLVTAVDRARDDAALR